MSRWNLALRDNWELILTESRVAQKTTPIRPDSLYEYIPIPPIYGTPNSHTLLIGTYSESAKPYWFLGARASQYLYVSPSTNSNLISGVQASETKRIGLNRLTLVQFPNYNILPYVLQLEIPYWLEDIYVEAWEYIGVETEPFEERLADIEDTLTRIEFKIDNNLQG